jgi:uncharacterized repeat protein (TIGR03803 family)
MKKLFLTILYVTFCLYANAQYNQIHIFTGAPTDGSFPSADLVSDGSFLYGTTKHGGANDSGTIFKIKPDGTGYLKFLDFDGLTNGSWPRSNLYYDGTFLYGMTELGGTYTYGTIFKIMPNGSGYVKLWDFGNGADGWYPQGSLYYDGTFFYGTTSSGGINGTGTIFKIKPNGSGYSRIFDWPYTAACLHTGSNPYASLISDGTYLYGTTVGGGPTGNGVIFKIMPNGSGFDTIYSFKNQPDGSKPYGNLVFDGTYLYGMTEQGGPTNINCSLGCGTLFKIKPDGSGYTKLLGMNQTNGEYPVGSLIINGLSLYGMTNGGGTTGNGTIFSIMADGTAYKRLLSFGVNTYDGSDPYGSLISDGSFFYGTTWGGGYGYGALFSYCIPVTVNSPPICLGNTATLTATGPAGCTYTWSTGSNANTISVSPTVTTTYTVTGSTGTCTSTATSTVTVNPAVSISYILQADASPHTG